jgi:rod shape-determining protein MreD
VRAALQHGSFPVDVTQEIDMVRTLKLFAIIFTALLLQVTVLPAYLADPFKPNLFIVIVGYLGLRETGRMGGCLSFLLGLLQDTFSGIYLGLSGFSYLCIYLLLRHVAGRLYTNSRYLMVMVVFFSTVANGLLHFVLLLVYPAATGIYATLLSGLIPQGLINALVASLIFCLPIVNPLEESR